MQTTYSTVSSKTYLFVTITLTFFIPSAACVVCGILVTKADIFPLVATKSASQVIINIGYPCLLFSKIVPASLSGNNIRALGELTWQI